MLELLKLYLLPSLSQSEKGQDLAEYGLLFSVIALVVIAGAILVGGSLNTYFQNVGGQLVTWLGI